MWYDVFHFILDVNYLIFFWKEHLYGWRAIAFGRHLLLQTKHRWRGYLAPISMMLNIYTRGSFLFCCELRCAHFDGDSISKNSDRRITFSVINDHANTWSARFMLSTEQRSSTDLDWLLLSLPTAFSDRGLVMFHLSLHFNLKGAQCKPIDP